MLGCEFCVGCAIETTFKVNKKNILAQERIMNIGKAQSL